MFQPWHAAKAIEGNLGDHAKYSQNIKSSMASFCEIRDSISASEVNSKAWHGFGWPHSTHVAGDSITFIEGKETCLWHDCSDLRGDPFS